MVTVVTAIIAVIEAAATVIIAVIEAAATAIIAVIEAAVEGKLGYCSFGPSLFASEPSTTSTPFINEITGLTHEWVKINVVAGKDLEPFVTIASS